MNAGWRYRISGLLGVAAIAVLAVIVANHPLLQAAFGQLPLVGHLPFDPPSGAEFAIEAATTAAAFLVALAPLYRPRPRRILDTVEIAGRRVLLACIALAAVGYFDYTYRLPRATLLVVGTITLLAIPAWFVAIRRPAPDGTGRTLIVGDDPDTMAAILETVQGQVLGYVSPPSAQPTDVLPSDARAAAPDGGRPSGLDGLPCLGGISRLESVFRDHDVDTAVLAFAQPDRAEFFGTLVACYDHGVTAKVHRKHADSVLTTGFGSEELVDVDLEPWGPLDRVAKRGFDVAFAGVALMLSAPFIFAIAVAIKLDDGGPFLYRQERTASFGDTFTVYKFRTMVEGGGDTEPVEDTSNPHITRIGSLLRRTHLDELPQLWAILVGDMSLVGPRAAWVEEEIQLQMNAGDWRKRWFVKPGLTGLAQINDVSSTEPEAKLRLDVEYIRRQSLWFDAKIVVRQLWQVGTDAVAAVR